MASLIRARGKFGDVVYCSTKWDLLDAKMEAKLKLDEFREMATMEYEEEFGETPREVSVLSFEDIEFTYLQRFGFPSHNEDFE